MKGVLKGFKYISSIFEEEQEENEIQIGLPTDVKHVAHIGTDGPSAESPSWMKDFSSERPKSAPLDSKGETVDSSVQTTTTDTELARTSRRRHHSADSLAFENSDKVYTKSKGSRRNHKKMNSDGSVGKSSRTRRHRRKDSLSDQESSSRSSRVKEDLNSKGDVPAESTSLPSSSSPTSRKLPDIPKKSRRKKVKDEINKIASKAIPKPSSDGVDNPPPPRSPPPTTRTTTENTGSVGTDSKTTTTITCDGETCQITRKPSPPIVQEKNDSSP